MALLDVGDKVWLKNEDIQPTLQHFHSWGFGLYEWDLGDLGDLRYSFSTF